MSVISRTLSNVNEAQIYFCLSLGSTAGKSGQQRKLCGASHQIWRRSSSDAEPKSFSSNISSKVELCAPSKLYVGGAFSPRLIIFFSDLRLRSFASVVQSFSTPYLSPRFFNALVNPVCQSRMVPPVSNVKALISLCCILSCQFVFPAC